MNDKEKYNNSFTTPENYFQEFEDRLFSKLDGTSIPMETGFEVPDTYFESVEDQLFQGISEERPSKVIPLFGKKLIGYAAAIAACTIIAFGIFTKSDSESVLELADIEAYLLDENLSLDSYDIAQVLTDDDIEAIHLDDEFLSDDILENYLLENIDDTTLLIE